MVVCPADDHLLTLGQERRISRSALTGIAFLPRNAVAAHLPLRAVMTFAPC